MMGVCESPPLTNLPAPVCVCLPIGEGWGVGLSVDTRERCGYQTVVHIQIIELPICLGCDGGNIVFFSLVTSALLYGWLLAAGVMIDMEERAGLSGAGRGTCVWCWEGNTLCSFSLGVAKCVHCSGEPALSRLWYRDVGQCLS